MQMNQGALRIPEAVRLTKQWNPINCPESVSILKLGSVYPGDYYHSIYFTILNI